MERQLRLLLQTGKLLSTEPSVDAIVQSALDAGMALCGAESGLFFYGAPEIGSTRISWKFSGIRPEAIPSSWSNGNSPEDPAWGLDRICRLEDLNEHPDERVRMPFGELNGQSPQVRSFLALPVRSHTSEVLGGMFFGHADSGVFGRECEDLVTTVAAQTASALQARRLHATLEHESALVTEAQQMHHKTAERLQQVLESTSDGVALLDRSWRFIYINPYANELVAPGRDLIGTSMWELFPEEVDGIFHQHYREAMEFGRAVEFTQKYEPLRIWAYVRVFPTPDGIAIFFQDVTAQKEAERTMALTTVRLRHALEAGQFGTWTWDRDTDVLDLDERGAELYGVRPHVPITRRELRERVLLPEDIDLTPPDLSVPLKAGGKYYAEYRVRTPDGLRWIAATGSAMFRDGTNEVVGMSGTVQNITARKSQEAALRQSEKLAATGRLAATIAHEINNPLEAVTNLIFLARTAPEVPGPVQRLLDTADNELARVSQIAQQTLGFYRDTARPSEIVLAELLTSVVDLFSRKLLTRRLLCTVDIDSNLRITGLPGEIKQVFSNLLVNAIDASVANTTIRIRGRNASVSGRRGVSVLLSDHGKGIPHDIRDRLFSPFFTTKESVGTGLGLWVTRGIVEKQGGSIAFRSCTQPPTGTVFRVFLPSEYRSVDPGSVDMFGAPQPRFLQ